MEQGKETGLVKDEQVQRWQPPKPPAKTSGRKGLILVSGAAAATLVVAGGVSIALFDVTRVHFGYDAAKAAYIQKGLPWTSKDMKPQPPVPDSQNAGPFLSSFAETYLELKGKPGADPVTQKSLPVHTAYLSPRQRLLDQLVKELRSKPGLDFHRDWSQGAALAFKELGPLKAAHQDLCLRAQVRTIQGDREGALDDLSAAADLAVRLSSEPTLISALVSSACRSMTAKAARLCASQSLKDGQFLQRLAGIIAPAEAEFDYLQAVKGEAYMHVWALRNLRQLGGIRGMMGSQGFGEAPLTPPAYLDSGDVPGVFERSMAVRSFEFWSDFAVQAKQRPNDALYLADYLDRQAMAASQSKQSSMALMTILMPVFAQSGVSLVRAEADVRATRAALLAWAERSRGRSITSLKEVPGGKWTDPFSDDEFKAKFEREKVLIWTVGQNGKDEGGAPSTVLLKGHPGQPNGDDTAVQIPDLSLEGK